jgi:hypothetical protein
MRIYLDVCCFNRPFDDQAIDRNRLESEAVLTILDRAGTGSWSLVGSEIIQRELAANPDAEKRRATEELLRFVTESILAEASTVRRAAQLRRLGFKEMDAFHIACAEAGRLRRPAHDGRPGHSAI